MQRVYPAYGMQVGGGGLIGGLLGDVMIIGKGAVDLGNEFVDALSPANAPTMELADNHNQDYTPSASFKPR